MTQGAIGTCTGQFAAHASSSEENISIWSGREIQANPPNITAKCYVENIGPLIDVASLTDKRKLICQNV